MERPLRRAFAVYVGQDPEGWFGLGQVLLIGKQAAAAVDPLRKAAALYRAGRSPYVNDARLLLAMAYADQRAWTALRDLLEPVYDSMSEDPMVNVGLAAAYTTPGLRDLAKAQRYVERARALGGEVSPELWEAAHGAAR